MRNSRHTAPAVWGQWDGHGDDMLKSPLSYGAIPATVTALTTEVLLLGNLGLLLQAFLLPKRQPIRAALTCPSYAVPSVLGPSPFRASSSNSPSQWVLAWPCQRTPVCASNRALTGPW